LLGIATLAVFLAASGQIVRVQAAAQSAVKDASADAKSAARMRTTTAIARLPLGFERNEGQAPGDVKFTSHLGAVSVSFLPDRVDFATRGPTPVALSLRLVGAKPTATISAEEPLPGRSNFILGNDPKAWRMGVQQFRRLRYSGVYSGIDLSYYGNQDRLEHDFLVGAGANPADIAIEVSGADRVLISQEGDALLQTAKGAVSLKRPVVYQEIAGERRSISGSYVLRQGNLLSFDIGAYDHAQPLVIDPVTLFNNTVSGNSLTQVNGVALDASDNILFTGFTQASNYPVVNAAQSACAAGCGNSDAFITKLDPTGTTVLFSTFYGGSGIEQGLAIAADPAGNVYITGTTTSYDLPVKNAFQPTSPNPEYGTAFVAEFSATGALVYGSYLGGSNGEDFNNGYDGAIAVDSTGAAYVAGSTNSTDFPVKNAYQSTLLGYANGTLTKIVPMGTSIVFSTFLGGSSSDGVTGVAVDSAFAIYLTGNTMSSNFPTTAGALATTCKACSNFLSEAFVTKFKADGSGPAYSTFLGDAGGSTANAIAVDAAFAAYIAGSTSSSGFPVAGTYAKTCLSCPDQQDSAFLSKLNPAGNSLVYSNIVGGHGKSFGNAVSVDAAGEAFVAGSSDAPDFTTVNPTQAQGGLGIDIAGDGVTFAASNQGFGSAQTNGFAIDPANPNNMYAATVDGVFKSTDASETWTPLDSGLPTGSNGKPVANVQSLVIQPSTGTLFAGVQSKGVYEFPVGATAWFASNNGLPSFIPGSVSAIAVDPSNPATMYVGLGGANTLYKSVNGGANWTKSNTGLPAGDGFSSITGLIVDPRNSNNLFLSTTDEFGTPQGIWASTNGGASWSAINIGLPTLAINAIAMDPNVSTTLYAATNLTFSTPAGGVYKTTNSGQQWSLALNTGGYSAQTVGVDPANGRVYAGLSGGGTVYSSDGSASWSNTAFPFTTNALGFDTGLALQSTAVEGLGPSGGFPGGYTGVAFAFSGDGSTPLFSTFTGGPSYNQAVGIAADPTLGLGFFAVAGNGLPPATIANFGNVFPGINGDSQQGYVQAIGTAPNYNNADMSVTKTVDKTTASVDDTLTYTIKATNNGPGSAHNPSITDTLAASSPFNLTTISAVSNSQVTAYVNQSAGSVLCFPSLGGGPLLAGQSFTCTVTVKTNDPGTAVNSATAKSDSTDPNPGNNTQSASTTILQPVAPTIGPGSLLFGTVLDGATATQPMTFTNGDPVANLHVTGTNVSGSSNATFSAINNCSGAVGPGAQCTSDVLATCNTAGPFSGFATIFTNAAGGISTLPLSGTCAPSADLSVTKAVDKTSASPGDTLTYTITIYNAGPDAVVTPGATDQLPANLDYRTIDEVSNSPGAGNGIGFVDGIITCSIPEIPAGESITCVFSVKVKGPLGYAVNTATVDSPTADPDATNNASTVTTEIVARPQTKVTVNADSSVGTRVVSGSASRASAEVRPDLNLPGTASGLAFDNPGNIWVAGASSVLEYSSSGSLLATYTGGGLGGPGNNTAGIAIDGDGKFWVPNSGGSVSLLSSSGAALSPSTGITAGLSAPSSVAIDNSGTVWVSNSGDNSVTRIFGAAAPTTVPLSQADTYGSFGVRP
jgi:uncharacterized repeat protein (TIGR01451 family)